MRALVLILSLFSVSDAMAKSKPTRSMFPCLTTPPPDPDLFKVKCHDLKEGTDENTRCMVKEFIRYTHDLQEWSSLAWLACGSK